MVWLMHNWPADPAIMIEEEMEKPMKVLIVGNGAVGKSSMIQRCVSSSSSSSSMHNGPTVGHGTGT
jgi:GTPase SAR1 family protein